MDSSPITIVSLARFIADPSILYGLFRRGNPMQYDPNQILFLQETPEDSSEAEHRLFPAETIDGLTHVKNELLSKPAVWASSIRHESRTYAVYVTFTTTYRQEYIVLLNTRHPSIAEPLNLAIEQAYGHLENDEKYCIELDIRPSIKEYFIDAIKPDGCCGVTYTSGTRIWITNHTKYEHCFDCKWIWFACFPFWLLSAPFYMAYRAKTCKDINLNLPALPVRELVSVRSMTSVVTRVAASQPPQNAGNSGSIVTTQPRQHPMYPPPPYPADPPSMQQHNT